MTLIFAGLGIYLLLLFLTSWLIRRGERLIQQGEYDAAKRWFLFILKGLDSKNRSSLRSIHTIRVMRHLSQIALRQENIEEAIFWAMRQTEPQYPVSTQIHGYQCTAVILRKQGKTEEAEELEAKALALAPVSNDSKKNFAQEAAFTQRARASVLINQGRFAEALQMMDEDASLNSSEQRWLSTLMRAQVLGQMGRYEEAIETQHLAKAQRHQINERYRLSGTNSRDLRQALHKSAETNEVTYALAMIRFYLETGKVGGATEYWEGLPKNFRDTDMALMICAMGIWVAAANGDAQTARQRIAKVEDMKPEKEAISLYVQNAIARAYLTLHDYDSAIQYIHRLLAGSTGNSLTQAECRTLLGQCYQGKENSEAATQEYESAVTAGFEEAAFTSVARTQLARLKANGEPRAFSNQMHLSETHR